PAEREKTLTPVARPRTTLRRGGGDDRRGSMDDALARTVKRWAKRTPIEDLQRRGVKEVRTVSMNKVAALLEKAVNRTLIERTLEGGGASDTLGLSTQSLSETARSHFLELTGAEVSGEANRGPDPLSEAKLRDRATTTLDRLKRELDERRRALDDHERLLTDGELDAREERRLEGKLGALLESRAGDDARAALGPELTGLVLDEMRVMRRRVRTAHLEEHQREVAQLERRIAKLSMLLGQTEDALRQAKAGKPVDSGVSSIYDSVQGLDEQDDSFEQKSELMRGIFEANLALRAS
ncbi:MAG: hypothetical protein AAFP86_12335, partial [Planctomycetota bacterium]